MNKWLMVSGLLGLLLLGLSLYFNPLNLPIQLGLSLTGSSPVLLAIFGAAVLLAAKYVKGLFMKGGV